MIRPSIFVSTVLAGAVLAFGAQAAEFTVTSPDFAGGRLAPALYANAMGCSGDNLSPEISWSGAPAGTRSFVVTLYDKDAPTGSGWWHWVAINLPADATTLARGAGADNGHMPKGTVTIANDGGMPAYMGACPPEGETHDYTITVKAMPEETLAVPAGASPALVGFVSNMSALATATVSASGAR